MRTKRIGKLQFALVGEHNKKNTAQKEARIIRDGGYNARVMKSGKVWQLWREVV